MRVFFAHPKSMQNEQIDAEAKLLADLFTKELGEPVEVVAGRDDYMLNAPSAGGWKNWSKDVATRVNSMTRKAHFDVFVSPSATIGGATQIILAYALHLKKPVFVMQLDHEQQTLDLLPAKGIICEDPENYTAGWLIDT
jgi:hypothetical protein